MGNENNFISLSAAVKRLRPKYPNISPQLLQYYVSKGRGPRNEIVAGRSVFRAEDVDSWIKPEPLPSGRPLKLKPQEQTHV